MNNSKDVAERVGLHLYRFREGAENEDQAVRAIAQICSERSWILSEIYESPAKPQFTPSPMPLPSTEDPPF